MIISNSLTQKHKAHEVIPKIAKNQHPHFAFYHCVTCNKFVSWISEATYNEEKRLQSVGGLMTFGKFQGTKIRDLPQPYLEWLIQNVNEKTKNMQPIYNEYVRRHAATEKV